jgi:hypothetical protein
MWSLQFGLSTLLDYLKETTRNCLSFSLQFLNPPDEIEIKEILELAGELAKKEILNAECKTTNFTISLNTKGEGVKVSPLPTPWLDKLKDRFLDKTPQFDSGEKNVVAIDVTSMLGTFEAYSEAMTKVFETDSTDLISCVILFEKQFMIESDEIRSKTGFMLMPNPSGRNGHDVKTTLHKLLVNATDI